MQEGETIKMNNNPLQPNGIGNLELEMGNEEEQELTRFGKGRILCGRESVTVTVVVLAVGGTQFFIFSAYVRHGISDSLFFWKLGHSGMVLNHSAQHTKI